jgi:hypothetical protein
VKLISLCSSTAYDERCLATGEKPDEDERWHLFETKSKKIYKRFYEPRLSWFSKQMDWMRHLRQNEIIYNEIIKNIRKEAEKPSNVVLTDSLPIVSTQEFMDNIITQSSPFCSGSKLAGESLESTSDDF